MSEATGWTGGAAQMCALSSRLKTMRYPVYVGCPAGGALHKRVLELGLAAFDFAPFQDYDLLSAWKLARFIDSRKIDIVHAHHPRSHAVALIAKYLCARKPALVITRRVSHPMRQWHVLSRIKYHNARIDAYAAVSESVKKILADFGIGQERIHVIYSGVDTARFRPIAPDPALLAELNTSLPVIGLIGNYSPDKGQTVLLDAAARALKKGARAVFLFAGRDTDSPLLRQEARNAGIAEKYTRFLGFRADVPQILSVLSVSVNAAVRGEALSGSIRESMAMRIPVLASDISGNREIVIDGETGALFAPGDSGRLSELIMDRLSDPAAALALAGSGLKLVSEKFTIERNLEATVKLYNDILA
ncbi:MAG: glycosyltransferase family 4 protein [Elusimicrobiaceae bacterium]|nr:glycosyltransferase family 4 protein [Elusimicrobiaceae bacterium]